MSFAADPARRPARLLGTRRTATMLPIATLVAACSTDGVRDATTDPAAPQAAAIDGLFWFSVILGVLVWLAVMVLLAVPLLRSRRRRRAGDDAFPIGEGTAARYGVPAAEADGPLGVAEPALVAEADADEGVRARLVWIGGIIVPAIILIVLLVYSSMVGRATAHTAEDGELVIDVVGHMFWWEVEYPDLGVVTANEIHVPVDRPVRLRLTTDDVIHSFWIPRLHGKVDMIPGHENQLTFTATETGRFRGQCAEFCGIAHAQMVAFVEAQTPDDFDAWVESQQADVGDAADPEGEGLFVEYGCAACHTVRGTDARGSVGPDLTHLASRGSLSAGIVPNTRENLAQVIVDPWGLKPGMPMPPTPDLTDAELEALLDYLEGLQ